MSLADELLETANYLLRQNNRNPSDAAIRRAISTAYYALFHRLIESATASVLGMPDQQQAVARSFDHGKMRRVCEAVTAKTVPPGVAAVLGAPVTAEVTKVAEAFAELQDRRHDADYNLARSFAKREARDFVDQVAEAFEAWKKVSTATTSPFLLLLLIGEPKAR
jgi:uncharacterized protein (UPF0332 family)